MMQVDRIRAKNLPPRATSSASSYHTTLERSATPSESVASLASTVSNHDSDVSSPPSTPELQYDIIQRRREGTALIIEHPTLVNFVPTSDIQTAVRVLPDCVIIDTILPPTATLRASDLSRQNPQVEGGKTEGGAISGFDAAELLKRHEAEVYQTLSTKLTENYDPTGTIKEEIFTTLTQLTRFPDPVGTNKSRSIKGQCPCICCEMGCKNPLEPYSTIHAKAPVTSDASFTALPASSRVLPRQSFLAMTEASSDPNRSLKDKKPKFGFLSFGRLGRSRSQVDLTQEAASQTSVSGKRGSRFSLPAPAPALPDSVTGEVVPPHGKSARSRSFSDLVRRRRKKHMAAISAEAIPSLPAGASSITQEKARASQSVDDETLRLPTRSSSQNHLAGGMGFTARPGRHSLDTTRVDTPFEGPQPPPRRSSKMYAIVGRKPVPQLNASSSNSSLGVRGGGATMPRSGKSIYEIGQIAEEDEDPSDGIRSSEADRRGSMARRQSAMISDFEPTSNGAFYENYPPQATAGSVLRSSGGGNGTQAWGFRSVKSNRSEGPLSASATTKPLNVGDETQIGVAI